MTTEIKYQKRLRFSLKKRLSIKGEFEFLENALHSFHRILPHTESDRWIKKKLPPKISNPESLASWKAVDGKQRRAITVRIFIPKLSSFIETTIRRKIVERKIATPMVLDLTEMSICKSIVNVIESALINNISMELSQILNQMTISFDDFVIQDHFRRNHKLDYDLGSLIEFFRDLSEQSYENSSLSFGVIIDKRRLKGIDQGQEKIFPKDYLTDLNSKKYRAFTDGYHSAFLLDSIGRFKELIDLEAAAKRLKLLRGEHYYPEWCKDIARLSVGNRIGLSLTRQGDILFFENGTMKFTRRFGQWQYWNHSYSIEILKTISRAQKVKPNILGKVTSYLYKYALDISFKHTGGLFVILRNKNEVKSILRKGDSVGDQKNGDVKIQFDKFLKYKTILGIDRNVILELASIDGAVVFSNHGAILAYGAILSPKKRQFLNRAEGSRSKAAIGASHHGVAVKISSDGDISIYNKGKQFIQI